MFELLKNPYLNLEMPLDTAFPMNTRVVIVETYIDPDGY